MIIHVPKPATEKFPDMFDYVDTKSIWTQIFWLLSSQNRTVYNLQEWFEGIVKEPSEKLMAVAKTIASNKDCDYVMTDILRWVKANITYTPDNMVWKMDEYWQTPDETIEKGTGDCEDGAILIAALARIKGVPANRVVVFAGSVNGGGHAWCGYRATEYPLNWCFMDWCYWYDPATPSNRTKYYIKEQKIYDDPSNNYYSIWFAFSDKAAYKGINNVK